MRERLTTPSGVTGTYQWLIRELAHHPARFTPKDIAWMFNHQPAMNPRWRAVLLIRDKGISTPLPDAVIDRIMLGEPFDVDGDTFMFNGLLIHAA